jgi:circadian clock protein KaiB
LRRSSKQGGGGHYRDAAGDFEAALREIDTSRYVLRLYISGMTHNSMRAIEHVRKVCADKLEGRYQLDIIDIYQQPLFARDNQIVAAPTLIRVLPLPTMKFIGDMSRAERILAGPDVRSGSDV